METLIKKEPFTNGSINPSLTISEMVEFDDETKRKFLYQMILNVGKNSAFNRQDIDPDIYQPLFFDEQKYRNGIKEIPASELNEELCRFDLDVYVHLQKLRAQTYEKHFEQGKEINRVQKELGFAGELKMSLGKLCGYITAVGKWNDFDPEYIIPILHEMDADCPRQDYGVNNINSGRKHHTWSIKNDYIFLNTEYIGGKQRIDTWVNWMNKAIHKYRHGLHVDSMRIDGEEYNDPIAAYKHLVMWWD